MCSFLVSLVGLGYEVVVVLDVCELLPNAATEVSSGCELLLACGDRRALLLG